MSETKSRRRNLFGNRKPRFIANGEEARDARHDFEPANIRARAYSTSPTSRASIPG